MVLITDGLPTLTLECMGDVDDGGGFGGGGMPQPVDSQPIVDEISQAREDGVRTFLIGSPGSEGGREWMSEAAILGATAAAGCRLDGDPYRHMDMTTAPDFSAALRAGLRQIRANGSCRQLRLSGAARRAGHQPRHHQPDRDYGLGSVTAREAGRERRVHRRLAGHRRPDRALRGHLRSHPERPRFAAEPPVRL